MCHSLSTGRGSPKGQRCCLRAWGGVRAWLGHAGPVTAPVTFLGPSGWAGNRAKGTWAGGPGVLQEILCIPQPARGCCALEGLRGEESTRNFHSAFPGMAAPPCLCLTCPSTARKRSQSEAWGSDPSAGPLWGQAPQTLLAQPTIPKSWQGLLGSAQPAPPEHIHRVGSAPGWAQPRGLWGSSAHC